MFLPGNCSLWRLSFISCSKLLAGLCPSSIWHISPYKYLPLFRWHYSFKPYVSQSDELNLQLNLCLLRVTAVFLIPSREGCLPLISRAFLKVSWIESSWSDWRTSCSWHSFGAGQGGFILAEHWSIDKKESHTYHFEKRKKGRKLKLKSSFLCNRGDTSFPCRNEGNDLLRLICHFLNHYYDTAAVWSRYFFAKSMPFYIVRTQPFYVRAKTDLYHYPGVTELDTKKKKILEHTVILITSISSDLQFRDFLDRCFILAFNACWSRVFYLLTLFSARHGSTVFGMLTIPWQWFP